MKIFQFLTSLQYQIEYNSFFVNNISFTSINKKIIVINRNDPCLTFHRCSYNGLFLWYFQNKNYKKKSLLFLKSTLRRKNMSQKHLYLLS